GITTAGGPPGTGSYGPVDLPASQLGTKQITESALTGWDVTGIACSYTTGTSNLQIGVYGNASSFTGSPGYDAGDNSVKITVGAGETPTCTFTNTKHASLTISKSSLGGTATFSYTTSGTGLSNFSLNTGTTNPISTSPF